MAEVPQALRIEGETGPTPREAAAGLLGVAGMDAGLVSRLTVTGTSNPVYPSVFRIATAGAAAIGAASLAVTEVWRQRTGRAQTVTIDQRHAAAAYRAERWALVEGIEREVHTNRLGAGFYLTADDRYIRFQTSLPHHRQVAMDVLGCENSRESGLVATRRWKAAELEEAIGQRGGIAAIVLSHDEWAQHPQGRAVLSLPVIEITKIADSPPQPLGPADRPLSGIRVMDLTRVISGPTCCRFLAGHGADVIQMTAPSVADWGLMDIATGFGKRSAWLDLRTQGEEFSRLVEGTDILVQAMRPGVLAGFGFSPEAAAERRPGIIYVSLSGFGHIGPWSARACYDSMLQCHDGIAHELWLHNPTEEPGQLPCQVMDHSTAYLAALGALSALLRRAREGGSYHVRVSLATTGEWVQQLGRVDALHLPDPDRSEFPDLMATMQDTPYGPIEYVRPAEQLSETPPYYALPTAPFGTHAPAWD